MASEQKHRIRPYGDHLNDGKIQLSFTLPVSSGEEAKEAARLYLEKLGLKQVQLVWMEAMGDRFTFFVAFGCAQHEVDLSSVRIHKPEFPILPFEELIKLAHEKIRRRIVVVGATTGTDAHTVGIDAILSIKGVAGDKGLEYYPIFKVVNLRAQVSHSMLVKRASEEKADAILVSQMVTQQDQHLKGLRELARMIPKPLVKIVGGPRIDHRIARSVGFDAGFGPGTKPSQVANYIVHELIRRLKLETTPKTQNRMEGENSGQTQARRRSLFGWLGGWREGS